MGARRALHLTLVGALIVGVIAANVAWWTRPRVLEAGDAAVLVEGREIGLGTESVAGFGIEGTLGLVGDRCVGFADRDGPGSVIVWPGDTRVRGRGESVTITSNGETFRLGDRIDAGATDRRLPELRDRLPEECSAASLIEVIPGS